MADKETYCTFLCNTEKVTSANITQDEILKQLENSDVKVKIEALKKSIMLLLAGEPLPRVLMQVIRYCLNTEDHALKKILMLYWEVVKKYDAGKKLLPEMILVCNALRNDLNSPNEYVRGCMLRFLCKLKEPELLEPLIPSIKSCLEHRHSYVRRNAALAVFNIHHHFGEKLLPDGPELVEKFIMSETDIGSRRNAFLFLCSEAEEAAVEFLAHRADDVGKFGDGFALCVLEVTRKMCRRDPNQKSRFVRLLFQMLQSSSPAVSYEAAWTLVSLSSAPTAIRAAASTYASLLNSQSDNNLKLIVLDRLSELKKLHSKVLQEVVMDILRALSSPNIDICKKTLEVCMDLLSPRNIEEVVQTLKREVIKTQEQDLDKGHVYRGMLIRSIHKCAVGHPQVAESVVHTLMDFLNGDAALEVMLFVRDIGEQYPDLRASVLDKLIMNFADIQSANVMGVALWILGEYCQSPPLLDQGFSEIKTNLGNPPFTTQPLAPPEPAADGGPAPGEESGAGAGAPTTKNMVLSDGTYATQSSVTAAASATASAAARAAPPLRKLIAMGDAFLASEVAGALTKLSLRALEKEGATSESAKEKQMHTLLVICALAKVLAAKSKGGDHAFADCLERLNMCCKVLLDPQASEMLKLPWLEGCRGAFGNLLAARRAKQKEEDTQEVSEALRAQPDDLITFRQLRATRGAAGTTKELDAVMDGDDLGRAVGANQLAGQGSKLSHVYQLSGFADPVYAEALVTVHDYDIVLEILVINRTPNTLTNLTVELATMGDLKLVERPQSYTIGPLDQRTIRANIKVSSTETGHVFGTIVYENSSTAQKAYINLNDIHLDIMDYIYPSSNCTDDAFRRMWEEFEWENKVAINTSFDELSAYLSHLVAHTNMACLTPTSSLGGQSSFLAANLYAKSIFGEDVLVNVSVEKKDDADGKLSGYVRIRSKTQGIALSLGDRITLVQRGPLKATPQP